MFVLVYLHVHAYEALPSSPSLNKRLERPRLGSHPSSYFLLRGCIFYPATRCASCGEHSGEATGYGSKLSHQGIAGFSPYSIPFTGSSQNSIFHGLRLATYEPSSESIAFISPQVWAKGCCWVFLPSPLVPASRKPSISS